MSSKSSDEAIFTAANPFYDAQLVDDDGTESSSVVIGRESAAAEVPVATESARPEAAHAEAAGAGASHAWYAIFDEAVRGVYTEWADVCSNEPEVYKGFESEGAAWEWLETKLLEELEAAKPRTRRRAKGKRFACYAVADAPGWGVYATWEEVQIETSPKEVQRLSQRGCSGGVAGPTGRGSGERVAVEQGRQVLCGWR